MAAEQKQSDSACNNWESMMLSGLKALGFTGTAATNALVLYKSIDGQIFETNQYLKDIKLYNSINELSSALDIDFSQDISAAKIEEITNNQGMCKKLKDFLEYLFSSNDQFCGSESYTINDQGDMVDPVEMQNKLERVSESYNELHTRCSPQHIKKEATEMLQRNNTYNFIQLALAFVNIGVGFHQFRKNIKYYDSKVAKLEEIRTKYINPAMDHYNAILQSLSSGGFSPAQNIEDYKSRLNAEKMIELAMNELKHLKADCVEAQKAARAATFGFAWNAISMGLQVYASLHSIGSLGNIAEATAVSLNKGICAAQAVACTGNLILAGCNAHSCSQWNDLIDKIEEKRKELQRAKENFDILMNENAKF